MAPSCEHIRRQMAHEIRVALQVAQRFSHKYDSCSPRLWFPRVSLAWLGVPPGSFISDDPNALLSSASRDDLPDLNTDFSEGEVKQGLQEQVYRIDVRKSAAKAAILRLSKKNTTTSQVPEKHSWTRGFRRSFWTSRKAMQLRIRIWRFMQAVRHSSHVRHGLKAAVGVAILTFPAFCPAESAARKWFVSVHGQWATIRYGSVVYYEMGLCLTSLSYLWVLETNTGATWRTGYLRIVSLIDF